MNNHTNKWKWPLWSVLRVDIRIPALVKKCWGRDALSCIWINGYRSDDSGWRESKSVTGERNCMYRGSEGRGVWQGWGTERRPIWVKCRELAEHGQGAAEEMDQTVLSLKVTFRFWILSWNKWEALEAFEEGDDMVIHAHWEAFCTATWRMDFQGGVRTLWKTNNEINTVA